MRYLLIVTIVFTIFSPKLFAGEGDNYFSLSTGALYKNAVSVEFVYEKTISYHNGYEIGLDYYNQCFSREQDSIGNSINHHALLLQGAYKMVIMRFKNSNLRLRLAGGIGADQKGFTCSVTPGFEYNYTFSNNYQLFFLQKNQLSFWSANKSWFRIGVMVGVKIPF